jgi:hypothetical protein
MPLNKKGKKIKKAMTKQYGKKKGEKVFYAMENSGKLKKVVKARGGMDASRSDFGGGSKSSGGGGGRDRDYQQRGMSKADYAKSTQSQNFGGKSKIGPVVKDVPFKKPLSTAQSIALSQVIPFAGPLVNFAAKQNYKGRQKFAKKQGLYRDVYKTTGKVLQPNSPTGKDYLKDAGFGRRSETEPNRDGPQKPILPIPVTPIEQIKTETSPYKKPTVVDGVFNYSVGLKKGGMLRQGKPKLAKKGWK